MHVLQGGTKQIWIFWCRPRMLSWELDVPVVAGYWGLQSLYTMYSTVQKEPSHPWGFEMVWLLHKTFPFKIDTRIRISDDKPCRIIRARSPDSATVMENWLDNWVCFKWIFCLVHVNWCDVSRTLESRYQYSRSEFLKNSITSVGWRARAKYSWWFNGTGKSSICKSEPRSNHF